jgi:hypothetical protein
MDHVYSIEELINYKNKRNIIKEKGNNIRTYLHSKQYNREEQ